jgi:hypothetical protein
LLLATHSSAIAKSVKKMKPFGKEKEKAAADSPKTTGKAKHGHAHKSGVWKKIIKIYK